MSRFSIHAQAVTLEAYAERAGAALACAFSSSDEFDAALIAARRAAGIYGPKRRRRRLLVSAAAVLSGLTLVAAFIHFVA